MGQRGQCVVERQRVGQRLKSLWERVRVGEQRARDVLGSQEGGHGEQVGGGRRPLGELLEGELPGGGHGRRRGVAGTRQQRTPPCLEQVQIFGGRHPRGLEIGAGLLERQRQTAEPVRQPAHRRGLVVAGMALQHSHRVLAPERRETLAVGAAGPRPVARGDQHVAGVRLGQPGPHGGRVRGVVEHQQPAAPLFEPPARRLRRRHLVRRCRFGQLQPRRQRSKVTRQRGGLSSHPPDDVIVAGVAVCVLRRQLALADPAQTGQRDDTLRVQAGVQLREVVFTPREVRTADRGHVPDVGQRAREPRRRRQCHRAARKRRLMRRLGPAAVTFDLRDQPLARGLLFEPDQVHVHGDVEQAGRVELTHPHRHEPLLGERRRPLPLSPPRLHVLRRQHRDRAPRLGADLLHPRDEVVAGREVPRLDHRREARVLEHPGDPLGPRAIGLRIAHEHVWRVGHGATLATPRTTCSTSSSD